MSQVILLNGCSSSGKSSIAQAIQHLSQKLWITFGVDTFIEMIPLSKTDLYLKFIPSHNESGQTMQVASEPEARKLFVLMPKFSEMLASDKNNLIIDEVLWDEDVLSSYSNHLKNHIVYYIGVFCDLNVMQERELLRRDRCIGLSNDQNDRVHRGILNKYDFTVDTTSISAFKAASLIIDFIARHPDPQAFKNIEKQAANGIVK
jgi:chloramphenicol 3-O phosphotransferase